MYKIIKDGIQMGLTEFPRYIKLQENGVFTICDSDEATGIEFHGTVYSLLNKEIVPEAESVFVKKVDIAEDLAKHFMLVSTVFIKLAEYGKGDLAIDIPTMYEHIDLFNIWEENTGYKKGKIMKHNERLYKCIKEHVSSEDNLPADNKKYWKPLLVAKEELFGLHN